MNVLVAAGGTQAPIDAVRAITNTSTGRLGAGIAEAALARGAEVWYLHPPGALRPFDLARQVDLDADPDAEFARLRAVHARWQAVRARYHPEPLPTGTLPEYAHRFRGLLARSRFDLIFLAMAASDYAPEPASGKLPSDADELVIRCRRQPKLIAEARDLAPDAYLVGFKLMAGRSTADLLRTAEAATIANRVDLTVANDLDTVRAGRHAIHLVRPGRPGRPAETLAPPASIAEGLVDRALAWARDKRGEGRVNAGGKSR